MKNKQHKIIIGAIIIFVVIVGILTFIVPPAVYPDPGWGFLVMRSMHLGGGFNLIVGPSPANISKNSEVFLAWWSPGQYVIPYFFKSIFSVNTGQASAITVTICSLSGLVGFYLFFKKIGFTPIIAAISLVFIMCQQDFWTPLAFYNGGEILLFAFEGWFLYVCVLLSKVDFKLIIFVLLSGWIGFICKSSFMWIYASGLLCLWIRLSANKSGVLAWVKNGLLLAIPAIISLASIYFLFISKGENPTSQSNGFKLVWEAFAFPLASPVLAGFSVDDLLHGLIVHSGAVPIVSPAARLVTLLSLAVISMVLVVIILMFVPNKNYKLFIIVFYAVSVSFFGYSYLHQAIISYEARHFRMIGLLVVPGIIYMVSKLKIYWQLVFVVLCLGIAHQSEKFMVGMHEGNREDAHGVSGISLPFIDQPSLNYIRLLDKQNSNLVFVFLSTDLCQEIEHNRVITYVDDMSPFQGHAGPLYILTPITFSEKKVEGMLTFFPGYKGFTTTKLSGKYVLYSAK